MTPSEQQAILSIALLAAFADGNNDEREREEIRRLAESLGSVPGAPDLPGLYREVLLKRVDAGKAAAALGDATHRQLAYE
ncbi:MAG: GTPase, partial [Proteobacteria bacterium]|nr:GTPase [Pseudomonadota bacterium]